MFVSVTSAEPVKPVPAVRARLTASARATATFVRSEYSSSLPPLPPRRAAAPQFQLDSLCESLRVLPSLSFAVTATAPSESIVTFSV